jgi:hypothetical protein
MQPEGEVQRHFKEAEAVKISYGHSIFPCLDLLYLILDGLVCLGLSRVACIAKHINVSNCTSVIILYCVVL